MEGPESSQTINAIKYAQSFHALSLAQGAGFRHELGPQLILHKIDVLHEKIITGEPIPFDYLVDEMIEHIDGRKGDLAVEDDGLRESAHGQFAIKDYEDIRKIITDILVSDADAVQSGDTALFPLSSQYLRKLRGMQNSQLRNLILGMFYESIDPTLTALVRNPHHLARFFINQGRELTQISENQGKIHINLPEKKFGKRFKSAQIYVDADVEVVNGGDIFASSFLEKGSTQVTTQVESPLRSFRGVFVTIINGTELIDVKKTKDDHLSILPQDGVVLGDAVLKVGVIYRGYPYGYPESVDILGAKGNVTIENLVRTAVSIPRRDGRIRVINTGQLDIDELNGDLTTSGMTTLKATRRIKGTVSLTDTNGVEINEVEGDVTSIRSNGVVKKHFGGKIYKDSASKLEVNPT